MKLRLIPLLLLIIPTLAIAEMQWLKDTDTGCEIWSDKRWNAPSVHISWDGDCVKGKASGRGKVIYEDKGYYSETYKVGMKNGKYDGEGVVVGAGEKGSSEIYRGGFKNGEWHGYGVTSRVIDGIDKSHYEGEFKNGERHGTGILIERFFGESRYEGQFKNGKKYGKGIETDSDGRYEGQFDNLPNGWGVLVYSDGDRYEGNFKSGKPSWQGGGVYIWGDDGRRYEGEAKDGKLTGQGKMTKADGTLIHEGLWKDGKPVGGISTSAASSDGNRRKEQYACADRCYAERHNMGAICQGMSPNSSGFLAPIPRLECKSEADIALDKCKQSCFR